MLFVRAGELKTGMRIAKPIYNKSGVMLYERDSRLTAQGIVSIQNFGLIGVYILEAAEPLPPMTEEDIEFERFQAMAVFSIKDILDAVGRRKEPEQLYQFANQIIKKYGTLHHKINFIQNLRSAEDYVYKHSLNTAILCALISKRMNLEFKSQLDIVVSAILHDIGTLLIPIELRKKPVLMRTEEEQKKVNTYYMAAYQMFARDEALDAGVKHILSGIMHKVYHVGAKEEETKAWAEPEIEILRTSAIFDRLTAMNYQEEPASDVAALRFLLDEANGYMPETVDALVRSINILEPGVCVELTTGEHGLVIAAGSRNVLEPVILLFQDNKLYNLADRETAGQMQIRDVMKTMDNRHVLDQELLAQYTGEAVHLGEHRDKKTY